MQDDSKRDQTLAEPGVVFRPNQPPASSVPAQPISPTTSVNPVPTQQPMAQPTPTPPQPTIVQAPEPVASPVQPLPAKIDSPQPSQTVEQPVSQQWTEPQTPDTTQSFSDDIGYDVPHVEWTASEYTANPKSGGWFGMLALAALLVAAAVYFLTGGDLISTVVIVVIAIIFGVFAARQPQTLNYAIDNEGFHIGQKFYPYSAFKSFSVMHDGALGYISLLPLKRFMPPLTIHYDPSDEDKIANTLIEYLPFEEHKTDIVDTIARKFRF